MKTLCVMLLSLLSILLQSIPIKAAQAITTQTAAIPSFKDYVDQHRKKRTATCTPRHLEQDVCSSPLIAIQSKLAVMRHLLHKMRGTIIEPIASKSVKAHALRQGEIDLHKAPDQLFWEFTQLDLASTSETEEYRPALITLFNQKK